MRSDTATRTAAIAVLSVFMMAALIFAGQGTLPFGPRPLPHPRNRDLSGVVRVPDDRADVRAGREADPLPSPAPATADAQPEGAASDAGDVNRLARSALDSPASRPTAARSPAPERRAAQKVAPQRSRRGERGRGAADRPGVAGPRGGKATLSRPAKQKGRGRSGSARSRGRERAARAGVVNGRGHGAGGPGASQRARSRARRGDPPRTAQRDRASDKRRPGPGTRRAGRAR